MGKISEASGGLAKIGVPSNKTSYNRFNLFDRYQNAGRPGYTGTGAIDWDYRGGDGPNIAVEGAEGWSPSDWQNFGAEGGTISDNAVAMPGGADLGGTDWFGKGGYLDTGAQAVNALGGLANAYTGLKQLDLAQDTFDFEKALAETNLANQANLINEQRANAGNVGLALAGNTMTEAERQAARNKITSGNVRSKVG